MSLHSIFLFHEGSRPVAFPVVDESEKSESESRAAISPVWSATAEALRASLRGDSEPDLAPNSQEE
jgi:hypothetical protein